MGTRPEEKKKQTKETQPASQLLKELGTDSGPLLKENNAGNKARLLAVSALLCGCGYL